MFKELVATGDAVCVAMDVMYIGCATHASVILQRPSDLVGCCLWHEINVHLRHENTTTQRNNRIPRSALACQLLAQAAITYDVPRWPCMA